jgi:hypothetical protein
MLVVKAARGSGRSWRTEEGVDEHARLLMRIGSPSVIHAISQLDEAFSLLEPIVVAPLEELLTE